MKSYNQLIFSVLFLSLITCGLGNAQNLNDFKLVEPPDGSMPIIRDKMFFNGYTSYWNDTYRNWYRYGNLFKMVVADVSATIAQNKVDIAEELGIPGLHMEEGFIKRLFETDATLLNHPTITELEAASAGKDVLVYALPGSEVGKKLLVLAGDLNKWKKGLTSHQFNALDFISTDAFCLENKGRKIFAVISSDTKALEKFDNLQRKAKEIIELYDLRKGWMGAETLYMSVTATYGHPLDLIGRGMDEGNTWFVFSGYNDFRAKGEYISWMDELGGPALVDVGSFTPSYITGSRNFLFGCDDYEGLQEQDITKDEYVEFVHKKNGFIYRPVYDTIADHHQFDGYVAIEGNKEQIDEEDVPFVTLTGNLSGGAASSMVLFIEKGAEFTKDALVNAIRERKSVGVLPEGKMVGAAIYRNTLQLLLLDRVYLEEYYGGRISLKAETRGSELRLSLVNHYAHPVSGKLSVVLPRYLELADKEVEVSLPAFSEKDLKFRLKINKEAMGKTNPIGLSFEWDGKRKSTVTMMKMPPAVMVHQLLYGQSPVVEYPVSVRNFSRQSSFPVKVQVYKMGQPGKVILEKEQICTLAPDAYTELFFDLEIPAGSYRVTASALGTLAETQLGVGEEDGKPILSLVDLNSDGVNEYRMENGQVRVTLLATGARVIEYIVKSKNDNVLFKKWPGKPIDDKRPFRKRQFYPFGGFEDFLGQPSMETHKVYDVEIVKDEGSSVSVKMTADYFGNKLEKIFTLYGNSPLLEVKFKLDFKNPEANMIGPQPILEMGKEHGPEDVFVVPDMEGLLEYRMRPENYYGHIFYLEEGWNAGYDTKEDVSFVGAFPVGQPEFLHMWMNHPKNPGSHYYYMEFQPWVHIVQKNNMYFSYYMWATEGSWKKGVKALRERNLVMTRKSQ